jgi:hypothetical protein
LESKNEPELTNLSFWFNSLTHETKICCVAPGSLLYLPRSDLPTYWSFL